MLTDKQMETLERIITELGYTIDHVSNLDNYQDPAEFLDQSAFVLRVYANCLSSVARDIRNPEE